MERAFEWVLGDSDDGYGAMERFVQVCAETSVVLVVEPHVAIDNDVIRWLRQFGEDGFDARKFTQIGQSTTARMPSPKRLCKNDLRLADNGRLLT